MLRRADVLDIFGHSRNDEEGRLRRIARVSHPSAWTGRLWEDAHCAKLGLSNSAVHLAAKGQDTLRVRPRTHSRRISPLTSRGPKCCTSLVAFERRT